MIFVGFGYKKSLGSSFFGAWADFHWNYERSFEQNRMVQTTRNFELFWQKTGFLKCKILLSQVFVVNYSTGISCCELHWLKILQAIVQWGLATIFFKLQVITILIFIETMSGPLNKIVWFKLHEILSFLTKDRVFKMQHPSQPSFCG